MGFQGSADPINPSEHMEYRFIFYHIQFHYYLAHFQLWHYSDVTWVSWRLESMTVHLVNSFRLSKKRNSKALHYWPFVRGIHWGPVDSPHKGPVMQGVFPCQLDKPDIQYNLYNNVMFFPLYSLYHQVLVCLCNMCYPYLGLSVTSIHIGGVLCQTGT